MKKIICLLACLSMHAHAQSFNPASLALSVAQTLISSSSFIDTPSAREATVTVEAHGTNIDDARQKAFVAAVQFVSGENIVSERTSTNGNIQSKLIQYSSGYVSDYKVIQQDATPNGTRALVSVTVKQLRLHDRLVNVGTTNGMFDGEKAYAQISTATKQQSSGEQLLQNTLNDFPKQAFATSHTTDVVKRDMDYIVRVNVQLRWNEAYVRSLNESIKVTNEGMSFQGYTINNINVRSFERFSSIRNKFTNLNVRATIFDDNNKPVLQQCTAFNHQLISFYKNDIVANTNNQETVEVNIKVHNKELLKQGRRIEVGLTSNCMKEA